MHERGLLRDLRREIDAVAETHQARRVTRVRMWIGALSHVTESAIRGGWASEFGGSPAAAAELFFERSIDVSDPRAQGIVLRDLDLEETSHPRRVE